MIKHLAINFIAYWIDAAPSAETFYLTVPPSPISASGRAILESVVLSIMRAHNDNRTLDVSYAGHYEINLSENDLTIYQDRIIPGLDLNGNRE